MPRPVVLLDDWIASWLQRIPLSSRGRVRSAQHHTRKRTLNPHTYSDTLNRAASTGTGSLQIVYDTNADRFNIHTDYISTGELRGQILPVIPAPSTRLLLSAALIGMMLLQLRGPVPEDSPPVS